MPGPSRRKAVPSPVRAELVPPRYRLAVIQEPGDRVVLRLPEIPGNAVKAIARELARLLPTLRAAAAVREGVRSVADLIRDNLNDSARPGRSRKG